MPGHGHAGSGLSVKDLGKFAQLQRLLWSPALEGVIGSVLALMIEHSTPARSHSTGVSEDTDITLEKAFQSCWAGRRRGVFS